MKNRVWFITGCSSGFGKVLCRQILARGERLVATARRPESLSDLKSLGSADQLLILKLDVTRQTEIDEAVQKSIQTFGRIDILINNAGYGYTGALEEVTDAETRRMFDTNVFGLMNVTRAVLPAMRKQNSGHIINLSSVAGVVAKPGAGMYAATKFAVEGHSEALAGEVAKFNIRVTLIEPGAFKTDFATRSLQVAPEMKEYDGAFDAIRAYYKTIGGNQPGDPEKAAKAMIDLADHPNPPLRLPMGTIALKAIHDKLNAYQKDLREWETIIQGTDFS